MRLLSCLLAVHLTVYVRWSPSSEQGILRPDVSLMCQTSLRPEAVCGKWERVAKQAALCALLTRFLNTVSSSLILMYKIQKVLVLVRNGNISEIS